MKTALITGGSGFVGSFIVDEAFRRGFSVVVPTRNVKRCWRIEEGPDCRLVEGDLLDTAFTHSLLSQYKPSLIIHAAWDDATSQGRNSTVHNMHLDVVQQLLTECHRYGCETFIGLGTQAEYGVHNSRIHEQTVPKPLDLYGANKLSAGHLGVMLAKHYGYRFAWLRLFSAFGPKDNDQYVIPYVIQSLLNGEPPQVTSGQQEWDYLYVADVAWRVWQAALAQSNFQGIYNLCSGNPARLKDVFLKIKDICGVSTDIRFGAKAQRLDGLMRLEGDPSKFEKTFGQEALTPLEDALRETIQWFKEHQLWAKAL